MGMGEHRRLFQPEWFYEGSWLQNRTQTAASCTNQKPHGGDFLQFECRYCRSSPSLPSSLCPLVPISHRQTHGQTLGHTGPWCGGRLGSHRAKLTNRHHQAGDKQEKKFIYIFQAAEQQWRFPGRKLKEQNSVSHTGMWAPAALWSLQCGCGKREIHSTGAEESEGLHCLVGQPGVWSAKVQSTTLREKPVLRAAGMRGHEVLHLWESSEPLKQALSCQRCYCRGS